MLRAHPDCLVQADIDCRALNLTQCNFQLAELQELVSQVIHIRALNEPKTFKVRKLHSDLLKLQVRYSYLCVRNVVLPTVVCLWYFLCDMIKRKYDSFLMPEMTLKLGVQTQTSCLIGTADEHVYITVTLFQYSVVVGIPHRAARGVYGREVVAMTSSDGVTWSAASTRDVAATQYKVWMHK